MSVSLQPSSQLGFQRPLTQLVKRTLQVTNHNQQPVAYKVKTTSPKQYCVRPNSGRIEPNETVEVQVLLQPMREDPPPGTKCRDKFLVQSVVITPDREGLALPELWQSVERDDKARVAEGGQSQIHEQKIRCSYLPAADSDAVGSIPEERQPWAEQPASRLQSDSPYTSTLNAAPSVGLGVTNATPSGAAGTANLPSSPPQAAHDALSSPTPKPPSYSSHTSTPPPAAEQLANKAQDAANVAGSAAASAAATVGLPKLAAAIEDRTPAPAAASSGGASSAATAAPAQSAPRTVNGATSDDAAALRAELAAAKAEIQRLKSQLDAAETTAATLRSRGAGAKGGAVGAEGSGPGASTAVVEMKGSEGVPVQVVVGVAFGVFVVTWLFF
ncbi:hypothetical protein JCM8097_006151 [Rhodosporidiobolus ruineniae]